jgi:CDGSH-type Zn-finger protein
LPEKKEPGRNERMPQGGGVKIVRGRDLADMGSFLMDVELARSVVHLCRCERSEHRCFQGGRRTKFAGWG